MNYISKDAVIAGINNEYRYSLKRVWDTSKETVVFIMLNPSTADGIEDDNTVKRCVSLAENNGFGGLEIVNLFALRATKPQDLTKHSKDYLIGDEGDKYILDSVKRNTKIVVAWGNAVKELKDVKNFGRDKEVAELLESQGHILNCVELTAKGCPKHPLFISSISAFSQIKWNGKKFG